MTHVVLSKIRLPRLSFARFHATLSASPNEINNNIDYYYFHNNNSNDNINYNDDDDDANNILRDATRRI